MKKFFPFLIIFAAVLAIYYPVLGVYFSGDDFFHFQASQTDGSIKSFINFFGFPAFTERGYAFYRPLFREALYNIYYTIFGLNHLPFRLLSFAIHFLNITLVYFLLQKLFAKRQISLFASFFFGVTAANVATLYYLAGGIQALGVTTFVLLTLLLWLGKKKIAAFITFLLALASHELAVVTPFLLAGLRRTRGLWLFFVVLAGYLFLDIFKIGLPQSEVQYQTVLSIKPILNSVAWYTGWALGLPEMLIDFVGPGLKLNPALMRYWGDYFRIIFPAFFLALGILAGTTAYLFWRKRKVLTDRRAWFLVFWFLAALIPVILLPFHKSTYYLAPALAAFWGLLGFLVFSAKLPRRVLVILLAALTILSATSVRLGDKTYIAANRGRIAQKLINEVSEQYPTLPAGAAVYFTNDPGYPFIAEEWGGSSKQASLALSGDDALQLLYQDPTLSVFYEDLGGVPLDFPKDKIYQIVARASLN